MKTMNSKTKIISDNVNNNLRYNNNFNLYKGSSLSCFGDLDKLAYSKDFYKRQPRKISVLNMVLAFMDSLLNKSYSLSSWASNISKQIGSTVSKQALSYRLTPAFVELLKNLLDSTIVNKSKLSSIKYSKKYSKLFSYFKAVYIQDSTHAKLNTKLSAKYPGAGGKMVKKDKPCAMMKINCFYDILSDRFIDFIITHYRKTEHSLSSIIVKLIKSGDLVIRDLGYFSINVFRAITEIKGYFVSRLKPNIIVRDKFTGNKIDLVKYLKKNSFIDKTVIIGSKDFLEARIIAIKLPEAIAGQRRRKARSSKDKRLNHSEKYYYLLGWEIYITNIKDDVWTAVDIARIYELRWRIEIIFKCIKSYFKINHVIIYKNQTRVESEILLTLIYIIIFLVRFYRWLCYVINRTRDKQTISLQKSLQISLQKLSMYLMQNQAIAFAIVHGKELTDFIVNNIIYYCCYEKRKRINYLDKLNSLT